jgi:hypothetical protein
VSRARAPLRRSPSRARSASAHARLPPRRASAVSPSRSTKLRTRRRRQRARISSVSLLLACRPVSEGARRAGDVRHQSRVQSRPRVRGNRMGSPIADHSSSRPTHLRGASSSLGSGRSVLVSGDKRAYPPMLGSLSQCASSNKMTALETPARRAQHRPYGASALTSSAAGRISVMRATLAPA